MAENCYKGINWGEAFIDDKQLTVKNNKQDLIKLPLNLIRNSNIQKNDIILELKTEDCDPNEDNLCEIRFFIPQSVQDQQKGKKNKEDDGAIVDEGSQEQNFTYQQMLQNQILKNAKIGESKADSIISISDVPFTVPRGKYTLDFFKSSLRFHGSTYQFMTDYKNITKLFLLPMPDEISMSIVIGLDMPLKQGQTTYNSILIQVRKEFDVNVQAKLDKDKLEALGWKNLQTSYSGPLHETLCEILSEITSIKAIIPKNFKDKYGKQSIRCSVGPQQGYLFPLEQSLVYISKPIIYFKHTEIKEIFFQRISKSNLNKFFDMKIVGKTSQLFSGIDRIELDNLTNYFQSKQLTVKIIQDQVNNVKFDESENEDDLDDDSRAESKNNKKKKLEKGGGEVEYDSEEDEDYVGNEGEDDDDDQSSESEKISQMTDSKQKSKKNKIK